MRMNIFKTTHSKKKTYICCHPDLLSCSIIITIYDRKLYTGFGLDINYHKY